MPNNNPFEVHLPQPAPPRPTSRQTRLGNVLGCLFAVWLAFAVLAVATVGVAVLVVKLLGAAA